MTCTLIVVLLCNGEQFTVCCCYVMLNSLSELNLGELNQHYLCESMMLSLLEIVFRLLWL